MSKKRRPARQAVSSKKDRLDRQISANKSIDTAKYKSSEYVEYIFTLEMGIFQADTVLLSLTDGHVLAALESLVVQIRAGGLPHFREQPVEPEGVVTWLMVGNWQEEAFRQLGKLSKEEMIGCLKTVIESVETRSSGQLDNRKYLNYLKKFMKRAGIRLEFASDPEEDYVED
ncbi:MAG: hypothetical protein GY797_26375, partial [Deltaproteobacteria bacterium]|nr:hypothetical protein [Deltaproteobacteria bacterium]